MKHTKTSRIYNPEPLPRKFWSNLTRPERSQLLDLIIDNNLNSYLEIGVMRGGNLINIRRLLELNNKECEIVGYDCFELLRDCKPDHNTHTSGFLDKETVENNVNKLNDCKVELVMGLSQNIESVFEKRTFDLIFHDADHSYEGVYNDLKIIKNVLSPEGYLCVHDAVKCEAFKAYEAIEDLCEKKYYKKIAQHGTLATLKAL